MSARELPERAIRGSLTPLATAREAHIETCAPIIPGMTHCASCGFSYRTPARVVSHRGLCATPERRSRLLYRVACPLLIVAGIVGLALTKPLPGIG